MSQVGHAKRPKPKATPNLVALRGKVSAAKDIATFNGLLLVVLDDGAQWNFYVGGLAFATYQPLSCRLTIGKHADKAGSVESAIRKIVAAKHKFDRKVAATRRAAQLPIPRDSRRKVRRK